MKIFEPTSSHLLLFPGLSQWKITACSLYYSSMVDTVVRGKCHAFFCHLVVKITAIQTYWESTTNYMVTEKITTLNPLPTVYVSYICFDNLNKISFFFPILFPNDQ